MSYPPSLERLLNSKLFCVISGVNDHLQKDMYSLKPIIMKHQNLLKNKYDFKVPYIFSKSATVVNKPALEDDRTTNKGSYTTVRLPKVLKRVKTAE